MANQCQSEVERAFVANETALINWLTKSVGERDMAREISQKTFLRVWRFSQKNLVEKPKALIFQTAARLVIDECRKRNRFNKEHDFLDDENFNFEFSSRRFSDSSPEEIASKKQEVRIVFRAIQELPENVRTAFVLHRFEGLNYQQIADRMNVSKSSVEKYMITALKSVRNSVRMNRDEDLRFRHNKM